jgi:hypothetical protein
VFARRSAIVCPANTFIGAPLSMLTTKRTAGNWNLKTLAVLLVVGRLAVWIGRQVGPSRAAE